MVFEHIAKYVGGKLLTAILVVAVGLTGYWFYQNPESIEALWEAIKGALLWLGFVCILPWALFFLPNIAVKSESNSAGIALLVGYLGIDILMAFWLSGWSVSGSLTWGIMIVGFLAAGVYNFLVSDYLAEYAENQL